MTTQAVGRIVDVARIHTPGALEGLLRLELFNALKDFLDRTDAWQEEVIVPVVPDTQLYALPTQARAIINRILWLEGKRPGNTIPPNWGAQQVGTLDMTSTAESPAVLRVQSVPAAAETWYAHVALTVTDPTDREGLPEMPDWLVEKYHDYLTSALIARMCLHPGKPYSSDKSALFHGRRYQSGISLARKDTRQGHTYDGQRWSFPRAFSSRSQRV